MIYRHGDLLIKQIKSVPTKLKSLGKKTINTLALGEVTGHSHKLSTVTDVEVLQDKEGNKYFVLPETAELTHEEHRKLKLKPAVYKQWFEREYNYFAEEQRKVLD